MPARAYKWVLIVLICWGCAAPAAGQDRSNPFEITSRLPEGRAAARGDSSGAGADLTPFDIRPGGGTGSPSLAPGSGNPAPATPPVSSSGATVSDGLTIIPSTDPNRKKGGILFVQLGLLVAVASLWVLFGGLLRQVIRGTVNDGLMNQIYTRRSGGEVTALWICYLFFFFTGGFFLYLFADHQEADLNLGVLGGWLTLSLAVAAALGLKQLVIWILGRLFPVRKETSRYAFVLMVFCILAGLLLVPVNMGVSYAPEGWQTVFLYGGLVVLGLLYLLHLARGFLIAGSLVAARPVHILLYICAVEIVPFLLAYRYLTDTLT